MSTTDHSHDPETETRECGHCAEPITLWNEQWEVIDAYNRPVLCTGCYQSAFEAANADLAVEADSLEDRMEAICAEHDLDQTRDKYLADIRESTHEDGYPL